MTKTIVLSAIIISVILVSGTLGYSISNPTASAANNKVTICHIPPGNPDNAHEIEVSEKAVHIPQREIRISFDFNVDNTTCVLSHAGADFIHFFREMSADNLPKLLDALERDYGAYRAVFKITGDSSGRSRHHLQSDDMNSYRMIKNRLRLRDGQFKVINNPKHKDNRFTCNTILAYHPNVLFHPSMTNTIYDLKYVECDKDENIIKKDRAMPNQKADYCDCVRYVFNTFHYNFIRKYSFKKK